MFDIIGDVHGCFDEFKKLTIALGYEWVSGIPVHPQERRLIFVGDITDRGPQSVKMIELTVKLVNEGKALYVPGNHCNKLYRYMKGRKIQILHGLETTVHELKLLPSARRMAVSSGFIQLYERSNLLLRLDNERLIICHAGIKASDLARPIDKKLRSILLYGYTTGRTDEQGHPERLDWAKDYRGKPWIVYGHTPVTVPRWVNHTLNLDTGCAFGGALSALRYPEMITCSVPSSMPEMPEHFRAFPEPETYLQAVPCPVDMPHADGSVDR